MRLARSAALCMWLINDLVEVYWVDRWDFR